MKLLLRWCCLLTAMAAVQAGAAERIAYPQKPIRILVPYGSAGTSDVLAQPVEGAADVARLVDVEGPPAGQRHSQLGERLEAAAQARGGPADPLRDRLELAVAGRDQREDAVRFPEVEPGQDDRIRGVGARARHTATVPPRSAPVRPRPSARCGRTGVTNPLPAARTFGAGALHSPP